MESNIVELLPAKALVRRLYSRASATFTLVACALSLLATQVQAARPSSISVVPTITSITVNNGQLLASGIATAVIKGQTYTAPFSGVPVDIALAADQAGAGACPILDLSLGPISLDLLGLAVQTSPICLKLTAYDNAGLLGDLLCSVANLLNGGLSLSQILAGQSLVDPITGLVLLPGLSAGQIETLLGGLQNLLNGALSNLLQAVLTAITPGNAPHTCAILHLELGPLDLNLLGLEVILDNCNGGPIVVDISGKTGRGRLLGNLLCELLGSGSISLGSTLQQLLNQLLGLLTQ